MERTVGIFFFVGLGLLLVISVLVDDERVLPLPWRVGKITYRAQFTSAEGLRKGDAVFLAGCQVGRISTIDIVGDKVEVAFDIESSYSLKEDSEAKIAVANLLGGSRLSLSLGSIGAAELSPGSYVSKTSVSPGLGSMIEKADAALGEIQGVVSDSRDDIRKTIANIRQVSEKINKGEGTIAKLINDSKLHDSLTSAVDELKAGMESFKDITRKASEGEGLVARLLNDKELAADAAKAVKELSAGMENLGKISKKIASGEGTIGGLVMKDEIYKDLRGALASLREISDKVNRGDGTIGRLVNDAALYEQFSSAIGTINRVVKKIDSGEGTIAKLINDPALYDEARKLFSGLGDAVEDAREQAPISAFSSVVFGALQ